MWCNRSFANLRPSEKGGAVFKEVLPLVDDAWTKKGNPLPSNPSVYLVDMEKPIGTKGETKVRIVVGKGINKIISAYPQK